MKLQSLFPVVAAASILLSGCVEHETVVERRGPPPPVYPYAPYGPPPPVIVETYGVAPYPGAVWIRGHWTRGGHRWVWHRGHWR